MSFVSVAALLVGLMVAAPLIAHLLRRGRARELVFPPARLVPSARSVAQQRSELDDRGLFALRALAILALALLGATPLVRCSRLALERGAGASLALALVVDDSLSMRAEEGGRSRFERALSAANELVASARRGDAIAVVLAGRPARVALSATTDLGAVKQTLARLTPSDRATDLDGAVSIARTLLKDLPQRDRQLAVLSDFAAETPNAGEPRVWAPVPELTRPLPDCGVVGAERTPTGVSARVACNQAEAAAGRKLEALEGDPAAGAASGAVLASAPLASQIGAQTVELRTTPGREVLGVRLTGGDALAHDDVASVGRDSLALEIAVSAEGSRSHAGEYEPSVVELGLRALGGEHTVRPISVLPDDARELARYAALILDDPSGLGPEVRLALSAWVERGGVLTALLGKRAESAVIGATLEPFGAGALPWESTQSKGLDVTSIAWLGPEASGLSQLAARGRVRVDSLLTQGGSVRARWDDGAAFFIERPLGAGLLLAFGLPSSADESDFALRPGFLALLDHVVSLAREHGGQRRGLPGLAFRFPAASKIEVIAPTGTPLPRSPEGNLERDQQLFTPEVHGRYRVRGADADAERVVLLDANEITKMPEISGVKALGPTRSGQAPSLDLSPEVARFVAALLGIEVAVRLWRAVRRRETRTARA